MTDPVRWLLYEHDTVNVSKCVGDITVKWATEAQLLALLQAPRTQPSQQPINPGVSLVEAMRHDQQPAQVSYCQRLHLHALCRRQSASLVILVLLKSYDIMKRGLI